MDKMTYTELIEKVEGMERFYPLNFTVRVQFKYRARPTSESEVPMVLPNSGFRYKEINGGWETTVKTATELRKMLEGMERQTLVHFPADHKYLRHATVDVRDNFEGSERVAFIMPTGRKVMKIHVRDDQLKAVVTDRYLFDLDAFGYRA